MPIVVEQSQVANRFIIDVQTKHLPNVKRRLAALVSTFSVEDGGAYWMCPAFSQIHIMTTWDEKRLDDWLCNTKGIEFEGVVEATEEWKVK